MKIRTGFVSNSSSSSFIAILYKGMKAPEIFKKMGLVSEGNDYPTGDDLYDSEYKVCDYGRWRIDDDVLLFSDGYDVVTIGLDIEKGLRNGWPIPELEKFLQMKIERLTGVKVDTKDMAFEYGEMGND